MVELKNVSYSRRKRQIINNLSLKIEENKITFLIGKNGAGKTTILEIIDLLLKIDEGKIRIDDSIIDHNTKESELSQIRKNIGLVFQHPEDEFLTETVKKELELSMNILKYDSSSREKRIKDVLRLVDLSPKLLEENPLNLNKSNKRKLSIACVLIGNPKIILLDEPTLGLDSENKEELIKIIRKLKQRYKKTFIITSHDMDFVLRLADYINVIDNGTKVLEGHKYDLLMQEELLSQYNIKVPEIIHFINEANKKTKLRYRDDINDLIKDIYRNVR